jgi:hypothetical protein
MSSKEVASYKDNLYTFNNLVISIRQIIEYCETGPGMHVSTCIIACTFIGRGY